MGVNALVRVMIMANDVIEIHRLFHTWPLEKFARICPKVGIVDYPTPVTLEMQMID